MIYTNKSPSFGIQILDALDDGDLQQLEEIQEHSERNVNEITPKEQWNWLHKALLGFDKNKPPRKSIEYLISQGININAQDMYGMTPLHYAMRGKNAEAAIALLEAGADPNIPNKKNIRPISMIGGMPERLDVLKIMLDEGADVDNIINKNESILESYKPSKYFPDSSIYDLMKKYSKSVD